MVIIKTSVSYKKLTRSLYVPCWGEDYLIGKASCLMNEFHLFVSLVNRGYVCTRLWPDDMKLAEF